MEKNLSNDKEDKSEENIFKEKTNIIDEGIII